ncbi:MAG TPA: hypothetical protein VLC09_00495, partial [Polyangiaceae bacterium]|nr:hypothetical protein [Polyangiaceae bacterium]
PLASLARSGTRVSALVASGRDLVAYLGGDDDNPKAFLWAEGGAPLCASEDATSASSVELLAGPTHPRLAILEGRLGMSPVHLRTVRVTKHHVNLAADEIIWIGPGSEPLTELMALGAPNGSASLFLATSRDPSHFGLAHFSLGPDSGQHAEPKWRMYENGLDPAPVHPSRLCRGDFVFYVAPNHRAPRAPQELRVARRLGNGDLVEEEVLARAKAFNDVSATDAPGGAVVAWTADRRTWALFVGCPG